MQTASADGHAPTLLLLGASRGLGLAIAQNFVHKGWNVVGTVRDATARTALHELADNHPGRIVVETLDITSVEQTQALRDRLSDRRFEILFVNAGTTNRDPTQTIGEVSTDDFVDLMITNALSPMRVIEALKGTVREAGLIGVMSSGQGSIANNLTGQREAYRGSKAALNQFMRSFAARHKDTPLAMLVMAPGWVRTELGGPEAPLTIEQSIPSLVDVMLAKQGKAGLAFLDYLGRTVPW